VERVLPSKRLRLDVGCGGTPTGDVNCDLFTEDTGHWFGKKDREHLLRIREIPNFVVCDSQYLPFREGMFEFVYCSHVIEHVDHPFLLFRELARVSNHKILLKCPHSLGERMFLPKNPFHKNFFKRSWFVEAARKAGFGDWNLHVEISVYRYFPSNFFFFMRVPFEITVKVDKLRKSYSD
jgi:hypothetical protein